MPSLTSSKPPSAVVLVIDQVTATMLGPYGNTLFETANFNRLAAQSLLFDFAFANSCELVPAYQDFWQADSGTSELSTSVPALVGDSGIESVLFTDESEVADHRLAEFDRIISLDPMDVKQAAVAAAETQLANFFAQAMSLLTELTPGTLCWLHSRGLHGAWDAPYSCRTRYAESEDPDPPEFVESPSMWLDPAVVDPDELWGLQQAATAQVVLMDQFLGVLLDLMESNPVWQSTLFCLTAPRGCPLGEHGLVGPGAQLFNESVQVPLMIRLPEKATDSASPDSVAAIRSGKLVQANLLTKIVQDWLAGEANFLSDRNGAVASLQPNKKSEYVLITSNEQELLQTHAWKLVRSKMGGAQLFAKPDDRCDVNDVSDRCPEIVRKMLVLLDELLQEEAPQSVLIELSDDLAFGVS